MSFHISDRPTKNIPWAVFNAGFPDTFTESQWSIVTGGDLETPSVDIIIFSIPSGNGLIIQDIEYRVDGGTPTSLEVNKSGVYRIFGFEEAQAVNIEIRTVTRKGASDWSDIKGILVLLADLQTLLFSNDEPGVFYDFDDWSTLFQDTAGTQPVTAANQGVALALDKRLGLKLGPELVTNGTFDTDVSGWTAVGTGVTLASIGGQLVISTPFANGSANTTVSTVSGRTYKVTFDWIGTTSTGNTSLGAGSTSSPTLNSGNAGTYSFVFVATGATTTISARISGGGEFTATYDNISVRELAGNHATQATTAARPLTVIHPDGGVRNLLDRTEELDGSAWSKSSGATVTGGVLDPLGGTSAFRLVSPNVGSGIFQTVVGAPAGPRIVSVWLRSNDAGWQFTLTGTFAGISVTSDWQFYTFTGNSGDLFSLRNALGGDREIDIWHPQFELGSTATPYQKRVNFLDVTEAGKRSIRRLYFNGTSHFMTTPVITPNTDKAQVFAGVRKLSDAAGTTLLGYGPSPSDNGSLDLNGTSPTSLGANYRFVSTGTIAVPVTAGGFSAPLSSILTGLGDISGQSVQLRINGTLRALSTSNQGTGNYLAYPMFIGARAGTSLFFNGYLDQLIARFGDTPDETTIGKVEKYNNTKVPEPIEVPELVAASEVTWDASTDTYTQNLTGIEG
jgi:hypothetical protein